jgi:hypothetical protein
VTGEISLSELVTFAKQKAYVWLLQIHWPWF